MRPFFLLLFTVLLQFSPLFTQTGIIGPGFTNGWATNDIIYLNSGMGNSRIAILPPRNPSGNGPAFFRTVDQQGGMINQHGPANCVNADITAEEGISRSNMPVCENSSAFSINVPNLTDNYIFKTPNNNNGGDFVFFRVEGPIRSIVSKTQTPANDANAQVSADESVEVTATYDGVLSSGQAPYLYYIAINLVDLNYFQTEVLPMTDTGDGITFSAEIPEQPNQTFLTYTLLSSGDQVIPEATQADVNYRAINFDDNNGAGGYSYLTVGALPVTFSSWAGERIGSDVKLNWTTENEQNASHFVVERSQNNGKSWKACATVNAQNNVNGFAYSFIDMGAPSGKLLYRLKQLDFDGQFMYAGILQLAGLNEKRAISVYPQPAHSSIRLQYDENLYENAQIVLADLYGRKLLTTPLLENDQSVDIAQLPKGIYLLQIQESGQVRDSQKIIKQ